MIYSVEEQTFKLEDDEQMAEKDALISQLISRAEYAEEQLRYCLRMLFGQSTEKIRYQIGTLFPEPTEVEEEESIENEAVPVTDKMTSKPTTKRKKQAGYREASTANMEKVEHHQVETDCQCQHCHQTMTEIGKNIVRREVEYIPARCVCHVYYASAYKCTGCSDEREQAVIQSAHVPKPLFQKSMASASVVAKVIHDKVALALPYHRQEKEWRRIGLDVPRRTLANWGILASQHYLNKVSQRIKDYLLQANSIHADETTFQILKRSDGKSGQTKSYFWTYCTGAKEAIPIAYYQAL